MTEILGWTSVEDRLPEDYENVNVFSENGTEEVEYGFFTQSGGWLVYDPGIDLGIDHREVSHWMPLPEPPTVKEDSDKGVPE